MKTVLLTGPVGSGKSAVSALLREQGIPVYDSDVRTKALYDRRPALVRRLEQALGVPLLNAQGSLDRAALARCIFADDAAREKLEAIVYPAVLQDFRRWRSRQKAPFVVLESAVAHTKPVFDGVWDVAVLVTAPPELRISRVMARSGWSREQVLARMRAQSFPEDAFQEVIVNDGSREQLAEEVRRVFSDKNAYICKLLKPEEYHEN